MRTAKKKDTQELGLRAMLDKIRENHIDIVPIIQNELKVIVFDCIKDVITGIYCAIEENYNIQCEIQNGQ